MDFGKSFVFMFEDPNWFRKLLIGTLLVLAGLLFSIVLIGIIPLLMVLGWTQVTLRNVLDGNQYPMPEWEDWGDYLVRGLKLTVALLVWWLPIFILMIPLVMGSALLGNQQMQSAAAVGGGMLIACASCLMLLWIIFVALITPAIYVRLAAFDRFSAAFELSELWAFTRANLGHVILALILLALAAWIVMPIIGMLGLVVCLVGVIVTLPFASLWQYLFTAHLFGQIGAYGNRPVRTPVPEPIPALPAEDYVEPGPEEPPAASETPAAEPSDEPASEEPPAAPEVPAAEPSEEPVPVEGLTVPEEAETPVSEPLPSEPTTEAPAPEETK